MDYCLDHFCGLYLVPLSEAKLDHEVIYIASA